MSRPPAPWRPAGAAYHYEAVEARAWRLVERPRRCRSGAGYHRKACGAPAVAERRRGAQWWAYCGDHLYGAWIEDGKVMRWRAIPNDPIEAARVRLGAS